MSMADILTPCWLKAYYLQQVRTTDKQGKELPEMFWQQAIDGGISALELDLDLVLTGSPDTVHTQRIDAQYWSAEDFYLNGLTLRPVAEVTKFSLQYGNYPAAEINTNWVVLRDPIAGRFNLRPGPGAYTMPQYPFAGFTLGGPVLQVTPDQIRMEYKAGFLKTLPCTVTTEAGSTDVAVTLDTDATAATDYLPFIKTGFHVRIGDDETLYRVSKARDATKIVLSTAAAATQTDVEVVVYMYEPLLLETAAMLAAVPLLEQIANWVYGGPGIGGKSLGVDAMHQSRVLAVAPGKSVYAAMIDVYRTRGEENRLRLMRRYERPGLIVF